MAYIQHDLSVATAFLNTVLPHGPYYCSSRIGDGTRWTDTAVQSIDQLAQECLNNSSRGFNTYFGLSAFANGWHNENGKTVFRTQSNTVAQRALWLDIDCGKGDSPYPDERSAVQALLAFLSATELPAPMVISSGHGLHLYWPLAEQIATEQWRRLASMLRALCIHNKFIADHSRTTDAASVLRVPGTMNYDFKHKYDGTPHRVTVVRAVPPIPVLKLAGQIIAAMKAQRVSVAAAPQPAVTPKPGLSFAVPDGLHFDMSGTALDMNIRRSPVEIVRKCRQISGAGLGTYTQWYNMMLTLKHCVGGDKAVHFLSAMDKKRYNEQDTQTKLEQAIAGGYGPCRCDTFNEKDPGICEHCPYWGKITSPIMLGEPVPDTRPITIPAPEIARVGDTAVVSISQRDMIDVIPYSSKEYAVVPGKGIIWYKRNKLAGGEDDDATITPIKIADFELYIHSLCVDQLNGTRSYVLRKKVADRAPEDILFDITNDLGSQNMIQWLGNHGMLPIRKSYNKVMEDFMQTYLAAVQNKLPEIFVRDSFGWVHNNDRTTGDSYDGFVVADRMYSERGVDPVKLNDRAEQLARDFRETGSLDKWKLIPRMYKHLNQPYPALMMCASFAAPFMRFGTGVATNVAYSLWDIKGGKGKSTVLEACSSVWGNPVTLLQTKSDTTSSRFQKFATYRHLPVFVDEITNMRDADMSDLIYDIVNGREKSRSTASGTALAKQGQWATITLFTGNKSLYETLKSVRSQSDATCMRVIEMQCDFTDYSGTQIQQYITQVAKTIRRNYGMAGPAFMRYCFAHPEVFDEVQKWAEEFVATYQQSSDERFWLHGLAIPLAVGIIARRAGFLDYDVEGWLMPFVTKTLLPSLRRTVKTETSSGLNLLADFLSEHIDNTLTVRFARRPATMTDPGTESALDEYVAGYPSRNMCVRCEQDTNTYYISQRALSRWCTDNSYSLSVIIQELQRLHIPVEKKQYSLGKSVSIFDRKRTMTYCITLPKEE